MNDINPRKGIEDVLQIVANTLKIKNSELVPNLNISVGDGFVGQFYTGSVKNKDTGEVTEVVIKKAPENAPSEFVLNVPIFKNEDLFYSQVFPGLNGFQKEKGVKEPFDNIPRYFCGVMEPRKEYIAMENLKALQYTLWDKKKYLDEAHLDFIFKIYGKFHALSFVLKNESRERYNKIIEGVSDLYLMLAEGEQHTKSMHDSFQAAVAALDPEVDKDSYEKVRKYLKDIKKSYIESTRYKGNYSCITHGDCWSNNMLFKYNDSGKLEDMKLIDFQVVRDGTPIHDLSYFFYSGGSKLNFDKLDSYLKIYHTSFSDFAKKLGSNADELFPLEVLKKEWKENALLGVFMAISQWQFKLVEKETIADIISDKETPLEEKMLIWIKLMDQLYKSDAYKERTRAILVHAAQYGVL